MRFSIDLLERRTLEVDELPDDDLLAVVEADLARVRAVLDDALLLVELHLLEPLAEPVAAEVERRAGRDDLDEAEALLLFSASPIVFASCFTWYAVQRATNDAPAAATTPGRLNVCS